MTRAWTLQEHVLSTRILHYTATELLFECRTSCRCECLSSRRASPTTPSLIPRAIAKKNGSVDAVWDAWQHVVEQYSKRELTVPSDRLPAISGIAAKIKDATRSSYIAGLWKENLVSDLLWSSSPNSSPAYALDSYRAPSFSWASLNTAVSYYMPDPEERETFTPTITLIASSIGLKGLNPLGTVFDASLKIRGPCLDAMLCSLQKDGIWEYTLLIKGTSAIRISHDCLLFEEEDTAASPPSTKTVRRAHSNTILSQFKTSVQCLSVARYDSWISGLVLGRSRRVPGTWERLGTFASGIESFRKAEERLIIAV